MLRIQHVAPRNSQSRRKRRASDGRRAARSRRSEAAPRVSQHGNFSFHDRFPETSERFQTSRIAAKPTSGRRAESQLKENSRFALSAKEWVIISALLSERRG